MLFFLFAFATGAIKRYFDHLKRETKTPDATKIRRRRNSRRHRVSFFTVEFSINQAKKIIVTNGMVDFIKLVV